MPTLKNFNIKRPIGRPVNRPSKVTADAMCDEAKIYKSIIWNSSIILRNLLEYFGFCSLSVYLHADSDIFYNGALTVVWLIKNNL